MLESLQEAGDELKRADHLIYVSLKYTRTVDVIKNIIERFINAYDFLTNALLKKKIDEGALEKLPTSPLERAEDVVKFFPDEKVKQNMDIYLLFRKISTADFDRSQEFRRHVTMTAKMKDGTEILVDIDKLYEHYKIIKEFFNFVRQTLGDTAND